MSQVIKYAAPYKVYKKNAAAQFVTIKPRVEDGKVIKEGAVLLEVAKCVGEKKYDWQNKISFAIGMQDLKNLYSSIEKPPRLIHQSPNSNLIKSLEFQPGEGRYQGTFMMKVGQKNSQTNKSELISVPLSSGEKDLLFRMMDKYSLNMLGWIS